MEPIAPGPEGVFITVWGAPGGDREGIVGLHGDALKVAVRAPAERGRANRAIAAVLATALAVPPRAVELVRGSRNRRKVFRVRGRDIEEIRRRLGAALS